MLQKLGGLLVLISNGGHQRGVGIARTEVSVRSLDHLQARMAEDLSYHERVDATPQHPGGCGVPKQVWIHTPARSARSRTS